MRVIFYNLHVYNIVSQTLYSFLTRSISYRKYEYLLNYYKKQQLDIYLFVDQNGSSLLPRYLSRIITPVLEAKLWALINGIPLQNLKIITKVSDLQKNDVIFAFSLGILDTKDSDLAHLKNMPCTKVFHLTHFVQNTNLIASRIKQIGVNLIVAENNLGKNSAYFRKFFPQYKNSVYVLPFSFQERFTKKKPFSERANKCLAIGTLVKITDVENPKMYKDFYAFFKSKTLQPMREKIFQSAPALVDYIDSSIGLLLEKKLVKSGKNNFLDKFRNFFTHTRRNYFKFDMVERLNNYTMCINGEEINNLPGIGFVEAMASGCAYLGLDDPMYTDLGLLPGKHYIAHDGSLTDLIEKIRYYQKNVGEQRKIAKQGYEYVKKHFSGEAVAKNFYSDLALLASADKTNKQVITNFPCSFIR